MDDINVYSCYRNMHAMCVFYFIYLIQAVPYAFIFNFIEKHIYHIGTIHYHLSIMCTYDLSLLLFYHDRIICMLFIVGQ